MTENPLIDQLKELQQEHRDLDEIILRLIPAQEGTDTIVLDYPGIQGTGTRVF